MAFANRVRDELARFIPDRACCRVAEVAGMALCGSCDGDLHLKLSSAATARKVFLLLAGTGVGRPRLAVERRRRRHIYRVVVPGFAGVVEGDSRGLPVRRCCRRSYTRGAFLVRGSLTSPDLTYHLEIAVGSRKKALDLVSLLRNLGINAGAASKRRGYVVYLKDGEQISDFLCLVEAHQAMLELENVRIVKDMRNRVNRLVNAETANMGKVAAASVRQTAAIGYLAQKVGLESIALNLRTVARARLDMPYASLAELGAALTPQISKSAVNHRLRRLLAIAEDLGFGTPGDEKRPDGEKCDS